MDIKAKRKKLMKIYGEFESRAQKFKQGAICKPGCAFCCTHFGNVDVITLEGLIIREWIHRLNKPRQTDLRKKIVRNMEKRENRDIAQCPFLKDDNTCMIYNIRPFSCRQLYSLKECTDRGPTVHRQAVELAKMTVQRLQKLDATGYSGHISYILHLLDKTEFRNLYKSGGFNPGAIMSFGKKHGIVINCMVSNNEPKIIHEPFP